MHADVVPQAAPFGAYGRRAPAVAILVGRTTPTNLRLVKACQDLGVVAHMVRPVDVERIVSPGDVVLARLDVLRSLDGVEPGLPLLRRLSTQGVRVLNDAAALLAAHDKAATARCLAWRGIPHPRTLHLQPGQAPPRPLSPVVLKPRFGSWGRDVFLCRSRTDLLARLDEVRGRSWFRRHGVIVQEFVPHEGEDLRVLVARGRVVGAVTRVAPPGEWRTSVALGATPHPVVPSRRACEMATAAAAAVGADLVGVDLLPMSAGRYAVLEVNGAVEFSSEYSLTDRDVFVEVALRVMIWLHDGDALADAHR
jgi:[lysine-biosynthesis-protein LysW]---L-2-aminoadipate ligase